MAVCWLIALSLARAPPARSHGGALAEKRCGLAHSHLMLLGQHNRRERDFALGEQEHVLRGDGVRLVHLRLQCVAWMALSKCNRGSIRVLAPAP